MWHSSANALRISRSPLPEPAPERMRLQRVVTNAPGALLLFSAEFTIQSWVSRPLNISDTVANICDGLLGFSVPVPAYLHELALPNSLRVILPPARPALQRLTGLSQA